MQTISLRLCEYDKQRKVLKVPSALLAGGFPSQFMVHSHHTNKEVRFTTVGPDDKLFDPDRWDGEQQIYRPIGNVPNVEYLVVYNC